MLVMATAGAFASARALGEDGDARRIEDLGFALTLPSGWDGRLTRPPAPHAPQLVAGNFLLPPEDGSVLTQRLPPGGVRLIVWDYGAPRYPPPPTQAVPSVSRADLGSFEGVPADHTTGSYSFVTGGRLFQLVATFPDSPSEELLRETNEVLATLEIEPPSR
jgi:hypothetical protein